MKTKTKIEWVSGESPETSSLKLIAIKDDGGIWVAPGSFYADKEASACWHFQNGEVVPVGLVEVLAWAPLPTFEGMPLEGQRVEFASEEAQQAILSERIHQDQKWPDHKHSVAEWLLILEKLVGDARRAWVTKLGDEDALHEVRQIVATGIACMEQCGAPKRANPLN